VKIKTEHKSKIQFNAKGKGPLVSTVYVDKVQIDSFKNNAVYTGVLNFSFSS